MTNQQDQDSPTQTGGVNWRETISGLLMIAFGIWLYSLFSEYENGETITMSRMFMALYEIGGKWTASGIAVLAGVATIYFLGIKKSKA